MTKRTALISTFAATFTFFMVVMGLLMAFDASSRLIAFVYMVLLCANSLLLGGIVAHYHPRDDDKR